jgi:hypothetical protein
MKTRLFILTAIPVIVFGLLLYLERLNPAELAHQKQVADVLQPIALSFGAIIAAVGGFNLIGDWIKKQKRSEDLIRYWQKLFPAGDMDKPKGYRFIEKEGAEGVIYLHDMKNNRKRWIENLETLRKVWGPNPRRHTLEASEFDAIQSDEHINIRI